jgi:hypothetical protein
MDITALAVRNVMATTGQTDSLNMEVQFSHLADFVPFTANKGDSAEYGRELYVRAMYGEFGPITEIAAPPPSEAAQRERLAAKQQQATLAMAPLEDADKLGIISDTEREQLTAWQQYRVALYRLPQSEGWPAEVSWPEAPQ